MPRKQVCLLFSTLVNQDTEGYVLFCICNLETEEPQSILYNLLLYYMGVIFYPENNVILHNNYAFVFIHLLFSVFNAS